MKVRKRKLQTETEALANARRENWKKALEAQAKSEKCKVARSQNARKAAAARTAKAMIKHMPLGAGVGDIFSVGKSRFMKIIDDKPVRNESGKWVQRFEQSGKFTAYGMTKEFSGVVQIVWDYEPTVENILDAPRVEENND